MCTQLRTVILCLITATALPVYAQEHGRSPEPVPSQGPTVGLLQAGFVALQVADLHSTFRATDNGIAVEANPLMVNKSSAIMLKASASIAVLLATHHWAKTHPKATKVLLIAVDGVYSGIVIHNYAIKGR